MIPERRHHRLGVQKVKKSGVGAFRESDETTPPLALAVIVITTLLAFVLVFLISIAWLAPGVSSVLVLLIPLFDPPLWLWSAGLVVLEIGILLHLWSRATRRTDLALWREGDARALVRNGPYGVVRHPSYLSYWLCFIGLSLLIPSVVTGLMLLGIPGYYQIAVAEEQDLIARFGDEYLTYVNGTGRFLPRIRTRGQVI